MSGLNNLVDFVCPTSACGLASNDGAEIFIDEESLGSAIKLFGSPVEGLGKGMPL